MPFFKPYLMVPLSCRSNLAGRFLQNKSESGGFTERNPFPADSNRQLEKTSTVLG